MTGNAVVTCQEYDSTAKEFVRSQQRYGEQGDRQAGGLARCGIKQQQSSRGDGGKHLQRLMGN